MTITLPERTLRQLQAVHEDRAQAVVKVTNEMVGRTQEKAKMVELVDVTPGHAIIVVGRSASLRRIKWLRLVEIAPGRNLLIIPSGTAVESLEVAILDLIEHLPPSDDRERSLLMELRAQLGALRRTNRISKAEIIFFDTTGRSSRPHASGDRALSR